MFRFLGIAASVAVVALSANCGCNSTDSSPADTFVERDGSSDSAARADTLQDMSGDGGSSNDATSRRGFIGGRQEIACVGVLPFCSGKFAGCVIDNSKYLSGSFPGARSVQVTTSGGTWKIRVSLFLDNKLSSGTETEVSWFEPGCEQYVYQQSKAGSDLFTAAGSDSVFEVEHGVSQSGDHLVEISSDSVCNYLMRLEVVQGP